MASDSIVFKVHYGGRFDRSDGCVYVGGKMAMHHEPYDLDCISFIEVESVVKEYGYKHGHLIFYLKPEKTLFGGLRIISRDPDVLQMTTAHWGKEIIAIYVVGFEAAPIVDPAEDVDEERERRRLGIGIKWWDCALSSDDDLYEVNVNFNDNAEGVAHEEDADSGGSAMNMYGSSFDFGGPFFELGGGPSFEGGGHSFEVGGPSGGAYQNTMARNGEDEHVTRGFCQIRRF